MPFVWWNEDIDLYEIVYPYYYRKEGKIIRDIEMYKSESGGMVIEPEENFRRVSKETLDRMVSAGEVDAQCLMSKKKLTEELKEIVQLEECPRVTDSLDLKLKAPCKRCFNRSENWAKKHENGTPYNSKEGMCEFLPCLARYCERKRIPLRSKKRFRCVLEKGVEDL